MKILLFDIDGTLLLTQSSGTHALRAVLCEVFGIQTPCTDINFCGRTDSSLFPEVLQLNGIHGTEQNLRQLREGYVDRLPAVLNQRGGVVLPGVTELLTELADHAEVCCYVMTGNLHETATQKLQHFGILDRFRGIFGGDLDADRRHLARRTVDSLKQIHGPQIDGETVVIGDTPADIACGLEVGATVLAVCTGQFDRQTLESAGAHLVHDDLSDRESLYHWLVK